MRVEPAVGRDDGVSYWLALGEAAAHVRYLRRRDGYGRPLPAFRSGTSLPPSKATGKLDEAAHPPDPR